MGIHKMDVTEQFKNEMKDNKNNDYNLLILIKQHMKNGELQLENLSSKQRSYLHKFAQKYKLDHYSIGHYNNRILVIKDNSHLYFNATYGNPPFSTSQSNQPYKFQKVIDKYSNMKKTCDQYSESDEYDYDYDYNEKQSNSTVVEDNHNWSETDEDEEYEEEPEYENEDEDDDSEGETENDTGDETEDENDSSEASCSNYRKKCELSAGEKLLYMTNLINIGLSVIILAKISG